MDTFREGSRVPRDAADSVRPTSATAEALEERVPWRDLIQVSQAILMLTEPEAVLQRVVDAGCSLIGAQIGIAGHRPLEGPFLVEATSPAAAIMIGQPVETLLAQSHGIDVLLRKQGAIRLPGEEIHCGLESQEVTPGCVTVRGLLAVSLTSAVDRPNGLIVFSAKRNGDDFTEEDENVAVQLAGLASARLRDLDVRCDMVRRAGQLIRENETLRVVAEYTRDWEYWIAADHRTLLYVSPSCQRISGYSVAEFFNTPGLLETIVHPEDRAAWGEHVQRSHDSPDNLTLTYRIVTKDGEVKWIDHICQAVFDSTGRYQGRRVSNHDSSSCRRADQKLHETVERLTLLCDVTSELLACDNPQELADSLCRRAMTHLDCHLFLSYLADEQAIRMRLSGYSGIPVEIARELQSIEIDEVTCGFAPRDAGGASENFTCISGPGVERLRQSGVRAHACHLLMNQGRLIGMLCFGSRTKDDFNEDELALMRAVADQVAIAVQRLQLLESVRQRAAEVQDASIAKDQFLAAISHDLRTPMSAILGMTELALGEDIDPVVRDYLQTAKESADHLLELLNQILDFSRIEAGKLHLESVAFGLRHVIDQTLRTMGIKAYEKGLELICNVPEDVPDQLIGDQLRLRQVLVNLVGNAIKFTSAGEVMVSVRTVDEGLRETGEAGCMVSCPDAAGTDRWLTIEFTVADTGIGMSSEELGRVFQPYTQADASTARCYGGSGLGLTISSSLVEMMGGRIHVESQPGVGSTFRFTSRFGLQPGAEAWSEIGTEDLKYLRDMPIIVVDDSAASCRLVEQTLTRWGMHPESFQCVPAAMVRIDEAAVAGRAFPLALIDANIPGIDGFTLACHLKDHPNLVGKTIMMLSPADHLVHSHRHRNLDVGCVDKPLSRAGMFGAILRALGRAAPVSKTPPESPPEIARTGNVRSLRVLLAEDVPPSQKVVTRILNKRNHTVTVANDGREAVKLASREEFDVILMDIEMPAMDGFQATAAIRAMERVGRPHVPVIAMTAHAMTGDAERCLLGGMNAYLSKPIDAHELVELVERLGYGKGSDSGSAGPEAERGGRRRTVASGKTWRSAGTGGEAACQDGLSRLQLRSGIGALLWRARSLPRYGGILFRRFRAAGRAARHRGSREGCAPDRPYHTQAEGNAHLFGSRARSGGDRGS